MKHTLIIIIFALILYEGPRALNIENCSKIDKKKIFCYIVTILYCVITLFGYNLDQGSITDSFYLSLYFSLKDLVFCKKNYINL